MEGLSKKEKEFTDMDNSVGIAAGERSIREINGNEKN